MFSLDICLTELAQNCYFSKESLLSNLILNTKLHIPKVTYSLLFNLYNMLNFGLGV